jgi:hypothetical protein
MLALIGQRQIGFQAGLPKQGRVVQNQKRQHTEVCYRYGTTDRGVNFTNLLQNNVTRHFLLLSNFIARKFDLLRH